MIKSKVLQIVIIFRAVQTAVVTMLRAPLSRALLVSRQLAPSLSGNRLNSTAAPEKVEVFVDDKSVLVEPGTTVLQVTLTGIRFIP